MSDRSYETIDVPVAGGSLRVGVWNADAADAPTALLVHGVTASHLAFAQVADAAPGVRLIAPDLRGRGASNTVEGPAGMRAHAADLAAVLDHLSIDRTVVVGHSMGAFVSVVFAHLHPERVARLLLIDGGLPLDVPAGLDADTVVSLVLGPTAARLSKRFSDTAEYLEFWRGHPAFRNDWSAELETYLAYDLVDDGEGALRPATSYATTIDDTVDMNTGTALPEALADLSHPTSLITVPRGLQDEEPGLYSPAHLDDVLRRYPGVDHERLEDFNHYTIVMSEAGGRFIAERLGRELALAEVTAPSQPRAS